MYWKNFLKPTKAVIIIFIIIILLSSLFGFLYPFVAGGFAVYRNIILIPFSSQEIACYGGCSTPTECLEKMELCPIRNLLDHITTEPIFFLLTLIYWYFLSIIIAKLFYITKKKFFKQGTNKVIK